MKSIVSQLTYLLGEQEMRANVRALIKFILFAALVTLLFSVGFQLLMWHLEGERYSFISALYWTVVTMTTLGYGDITFTTEAGRAFSVFVLISGIVLFLIVLPFVFIRYFYAPWLEAQVRLRAPLQVASGTRDHVIICREYTIAPGLIRHFDLQQVPYVLLEADPERAARMQRDGIEVVTGEVDAVETYERAAVQSARLLFANFEDVENANILLTAREAAPEVPTAAIISSDDSQDILELAGCDHILPLRRQLGRQLANRVNAGHAQTHVIGRFHDIVIAEFPVLNTPLVGKTIREIQLRENFGLNLMGVWDQGEFRAATPNYELTDLCLPVVAGTEQQMQALDELLFIYDTNWNPVVVIGGGKVGRAATRALKEKGVPVHLIERKAELKERIGSLPDHLFIGDAANRDLLAEAGLDEAPAVLLTTNDDAMNVYLAAYCRGLRKNLRIVSRVTHERNVQSIRRAGADLALSYAQLGAEAVLALAHGREIVLVGTGVEFIDLPVPPALAGRTLAESEIGAETGLNVMALETPQAFITNPRADQVIPKDGILHTIGTEKQVQAFLKTFA